MKGNSSMTTTGRCLCGAIHYEYDSKPLDAIHCHCDSCRRQTSSPVATFVLVPKTALRFTRGQPKEFASSPGVRRSFCGECGSPIAYQTAAATGRSRSLRGNAGRPGFRRPVVPCVRRGAAPLVRGARRSAALCADAPRGHADPAWAARHWMNLFSRGAPAPHSRDAAPRCRSAAAGRCAAPDPPSSPATG